MENSSKKVVVVGSGSAGITAALAAKEAGLEPMIVESTSLLGGSSAMSGGGLWIPNNPLMLKAGVHDSYEEAKLYMDTVIGEVGPASSRERRETFLREGPRMVEWLSGLGFRFSYTPGYAPRGGEWRNVRRICREEDPCAKRLVQLLCRPN
jgi:succinate dehydrogenase/fumarate reductase flavoprotein subunit